MHLIFLWLAAGASPEPASETTETLAGVSEVIEETKLATFVPIRMSRRLANAFEGFGTLDDCGPVRAAIRLSRSAIRVGMTTGDRREIRNLDGARDWASLAAVLREYAASPHFEAGGDIELTAEPEVIAGDIASALHVAVDSGFARPRYVPPGWETPRLIDPGLSLDERFPLRTIGFHSVAIVIHDGGVLIGSDTGGLDFIPSRRRGRYDFEAIGSVLASTREAARRRRLAGRYLMVRDFSSTYSDAEEVIAALDELGYAWVDDDWIRVDEDWIRVAHDIE